VSDSHHICESLVQEAVDEHHQIQRQSRLSLQNHCHAVHFLDLDAKHNLLTVNLSFDLLWIPCTGLELSEVRG
jgi:hypothetical protein